MDINFGIITINLYNVLFTAINLLILFIFLKKFLFGRVNKIIEQRQTLIDNQLSDAQKAKDDAQELKSQYDSYIEKAGNDSKKIITEARIKGQLQYNDIIDTAKAKADKMEAEAQARIAEEHLAALQKMEGQLVALICDTTSKVLGESCTPEINSKIINNIDLKAGVSK